VSVNQGNGVTNISATLDPSDEKNCSRMNINVSLRVTLVGRFDGNRRESNTGSSKETTGGVTTKYNTQSDVFTETFTGTTGLYSGAFTGEAFKEKRTDRTRVK
jgi:hypothetical protein